MSSRVHEAVSLWSSATPLNTLSTPGRMPISTGGTSTVRRSDDGIRRFCSEQDRYSGDRFRPELVALGAGDHNVFALVRVGPEGGTNSWMRVIVYEVSDREITGPGLRG